MIETTPEELTATAAIYMLVWYAIDLTFGWIHYVVWLRHRKDLYGSAYIALYLLLLISGILFCSTGGTVFLLRSIKYAVANRRQRTTLVLGISFVFFPYSLPITLLTLRMAYTFGYPSFLFGITFTVHGMGCACGGAVVHAGYMWKMSRLLENRFLVWSGAKKGEMKGIAGKGYGVVPLTCGPHAPGPEIPAQLQMQSPTRPTKKPLSS
eukprot:NODE_164_length_1313_cov_618.661889_g160_i0.p1 GENE.NODE_164_length_1313_cov_618.661889_g160_i0~~NODE_164_length_1313_cov_618.661889_g160_i0.p1  ORF type:complete len:209 (+),score=44.71 NODE_164_length_1313_cov_618.661889_g160_i0:582-1208(+)